MNLLPVLLAAAFFLSPASSKEDNVSQSDRFINMNYDWALFVDLHEMKDYMTYANSKLYPIEVAEIDLRVTHRDLPKKNVPPQAQIPYEDLFFYNGRAIGLKRYRELSGLQNKIGVIIVSTKNSDASSGQATANLLVKLMLELGKERMDAVNVEVPENIYDFVTSGLRNYDFKPTMKQGAQFCLRLAENGALENENYYYQRSDE